MILRLSCQTLGFLIQDFSNFNSYLILLLCLLYMKYAMVAPLQQLKELNMKLPKLFTDSIAFHAST